MAEDEGRDDNRGRRSRTVGIAGESSIILADVYRPDTDLGNLNVSASTLSDWGEGWGLKSVPTYYRLFAAVSPRVLSMRLGMQSVR